MDWNPRFDMQFLSGYRDQLTFAACLQLGFLLVAGLVLDGGELLWIMTVAAIGYWCAIGIILLRRDGRGTGLDRFVMRWGFLFAVVLAFLAAGVRSEFH